MVADAGFGESGSATDHATCDHFFVGEIEDCRSDNLVGRTRDEKRK
jgi:hypothetical protein